MIAFLIALVTFITRVVGLTYTTADNVDAQTTIGIFIGDMDDPYQASFPILATAGVVGSIVGADSCDTTVALTCTDYYACSGVDFTAIQGPSLYSVSFVGSSSGVSISVTESCALAGPTNSPTRAVCHATAKATISGRSTSTKITATITGTPTLSYVQVPITAGANLLTAGTATCAAAAAPAKTGLVDVYKVLVPLGAAVLAFT